MTCYSRHTGMRALNASSPIFLELFWLTLSVSLTCSLPVTANGQTVILSRNSEFEKPTRNSEFEKPTEEGTGRKGLDNTPSGGTLPGGTVPDGTVPGGTVPGGMTPRRNGSGRNSAWRDAPRWNSSGRNTA